MSNNGNELFLFTSDGAQAVLDYMRNLAAQVLVGIAWIVFSVRSNELTFSGNTLVFWSVTLATIFIFFYMVIANLMIFTSKIIEHMDKVIKGIDGYKQCEANYSFNIYFKHVIWIFGLVAKNKKLLIIECIFALIFLIVPTVIVFIISMGQANQLYKTLVGG